MHQRRVGACCIYFSMDYSCLLYKFDCIEYVHQSGSWVDWQRSATWAIGALQVSQATRCAHVVGHDWALLEGCHGVFFFVRKQQCVHIENLLVLASMQSMGVKHCVAWTHLNVIKRAFAWMKHKFN